MEAVAAYFGHCKSVHVSGAFVLRAGKAGLKPLDVEQLSKASKDSVTNYIKPCT